jgi:hypothetical protein
LDRIDLSTVPFSRLNLAVLAVPLGRREAHVCGIVAVRTVEQ